MYSISEVLRDLNRKAMDIEDLRQAWKDHHNLGGHQLVAFWESTFRVSFEIGEITYYSTYRDENSDLKLHGFGLVE